ncbi:RagB/SusD family nutrient uptake outer membrane protein [Pontibacter akesuensis]|uniref:RagB/SusD domain-containing protein n=1 Tax=Pontibacter akesuensis TaxID=388950 RepID=A0A1I7JYI6_9BACT|nr:RagB/SusD family nutrient uptake outer membrane protein [Pontibacter akesuensis]SFU90155.1 RagB/SusD domain-containing protein [Pontibacter akesuensis]
MKRYIKQLKYKPLVAMLAMAMVLPACELDDIPDPNNPTVESLLQNATVDDLNNLVVGTVSGMRNGLGTYYDNVGVIGREHYRFSGADPRFTSDLLGAVNATLDNNTFYTTTPWSTRYRVVKNTNLLIEAVNNTELITEEQRQAYLGFAKTIKAYQLLLNLTMMNENGIRLDVEDPDNLGPIVDKATALAAISELFDEAAAHIAQAGESFPFPLAGFSGNSTASGENEFFDEPAGFLKFNRALAARVAIYRGNFTEALSLLEDSFFDLTAPFDRGVYYVFSTSPGDQLNPLYFAPNAAGEVRIAHPSFIADIAPNDDRATKVSRREQAATQSGLTGQYDVALYETNTAPVPIIRNEELILIYAEANIQTGDLGEAVRALNIIRRGHGLQPYTGPVTQAALIDEMLYQRRYSLYFEGHRWVDLRRYNRLDQLPIDRAGDDVWVNFPIPFAENI